MPGCSPVFSQEMSTLNDPALKKAFDAIDEDHDGYIDEVELKRALEKTGLQPGIQEIKDLIKEVDTNKNGKVELDEFGALWKKISSNEYAEKVGGLTKLNLMRMNDVGKYPEGSGKWKKTNSSGFYGSTGGGVYEREPGPATKKGPPRKKDISELP